MDGCIVGNDWLSAKKEKQVLVVDLLCLSKGKNAE